MSKPTQSIDTCYSYNASVGSVPEVVLDRPAWLPDGERVNGVPVDACMAKVIKHLWDSGIHTLGCCCGHGGKLHKLPNIILSENVTDIPRVRDLIFEVDGRNFELKQWRLINV